jgi:hypothetical protein
MAVRLISLSLLLLLTAGTGSIHAQSVVGKLGRLLTEQRPTTPEVVPDVSAAVATAQTVAGLFAVELSNLPLASSSGGFVYRLNPSLGVFERASSGFGPFYTERLIRNSKGQSSIGFSLQAASFNSLQGADLRNGTFPTNAARVSGSTTPFSVDTLALDLDGHTVVGFGSYGVTDRFTVGAAVPIVQVRFTGSRVRTVDGQSTLQSSQAGSATGLGDIALQARYVLAGETRRGVAIGSDLRLPTGRAEDLLGAGETAVRVLGIGSWEEDRLAVHLNGGFGLGGASREIFWSTATTFAATPRVTVVGEVMGRQLEELSLVADVYQPHSITPGVETMRWLPADNGVYTTFLVAGAKWNLVSSWLLNTSLLVRVTDPGLRARLVPTISIDYAFEP